MKPVIAAHAFTLFAAPAFAESAPALDFTTQDWTLLSMDGSDVTFDATINLGEPGHVSGQAPCNRYFGEAVSDGAALKFGALGATMMACENMQAESDFLAALAAVDTAALGEDGTLTLTGGAHTLVFAVSEE